MDNYELRSERDGINRYNVYLNNDTLGYIEYTPRIGWMAYRPCGGLLHLDPIAAQYDAELFLVERHEDQEREKSKFRARCAQGRRVQRIPSDFPNAVALVVARLENCFDKVSLPLRVWRCDGAVVSGRCSLRGPYGFIVATTDFPDHLIDDAAEGRLEEAP